MELRFYDRNMNFLGLTESQTSMIWTRRYNTVGSFEIHIPLTASIAPYCKRGYFVTYTGATEAGVIEEIELNDTPELSEAILRGRFAEAFFDLRVVTGTYRCPAGAWDYITPAWVQVSTAEEAMRNIVTRFAYNSTITPQQLPFVQLGTNHQLPTTAEFQATYRNALGLLEEIAMGAGYGFKLVPDFTNKKLSFEVYSGLDKSRNNGVRPFVEFSDTFANVETSNYVENDSLYRNYAYVGGHGEGSARTFTETTIADGFLTGLDRREVFIDARDISQDEDMTDAQYLRLLAQRAKERMADEYAFSQSFNCTANASTNFVYRTDYDLGDIVTVVREDWGISLDLRITELAEVYENGGMTVIPTFGESTVTVIDWEDSSQGDSYEDVKTLKSNVSTAQSNIETLNEKTTNNNVELTVADTSVATIGGLRLYKTNKVCTLMGYITAVDLPTSLKTVATVPAGSRPVSSTALNIYSTLTGLANSVGVVNAGGTIQVRLSTARTSGNIYLSASWTTT